ncbi:MAG: signal recognition particle-docking protein FtsY [Eubacteriales bacterium]|nr:signal recognition particle-docking protein FtsY [Eubacteriales bacterium]
MAFFDKFKAGLNKTRSFILDAVMQTDATQTHYLDEDILDELEMALVQTDMGADCVDRLTAKLRERLAESTKYELKTAFQDLQADMLDILGPARQLQINPRRLNIILMVGVNGSGKTTTAGKLAQRWINEGNRVLLAAADTFRAAAIEQLQHWAELTGAQFVAQKEGSDPAAIVFDALKAAKARNCNAIIIDTAGRLQNKKNLMDELAKIRRVIDKEAAGCITRNLIVIDSSTGQNAVIQAQTFTEVSRVDGIVITKLDGSAKGGVALAVSAQTHKPIYLVGLGEGVDDLVDFDPEAFIASLLPSEEDLIAEDLAD